MFRKRVKEELQYILTRMHELDESYTARMVMLEVELNSAIVDGDLAREKVISSRMATTQAQYEREYKALGEQYERLAKNSDNNLISTLVSCAFNLLSMGFVMNYERFHVIVSKAWNLIPKMKI